MNPIVGPTPFSATKPRESAMIPDKSLKKQLRGALRAGHIRAYLLIAPLALYLLITFIVPIGVMLYTSVHDPLIVGNMPNTVRELRHWTPVRDLAPPPIAFAALARDLKAADERQTASEVASRLNFESGGLRSVLMHAARAVGRSDGGTEDWQSRIIQADPAWGTQEPWVVLKGLSHVYTPGYYLAALDLTYRPGSGLQREPQSSRIYVDVFARTFGIGLLVTACCLVLGYPVAFLLANVKAKTGNLLLIFVLLPFWTSLLVRTTAWIVLLQQEGVVNKLLMSLGVISAPLALVYNRTGVVITMTHILLPFMILPLYSVMKSIPSNLTRAARSLGASPTRSFWKIYVPLSLPGVSAGVLLVFILSIGYYITPALVGGAADQMVSYFVADNLSRSLNWGLAAALGGILLTTVLVLYVVYQRFVGVENVKLA